MSVLIWKVNKVGNTIGQCDGRCYDNRFPYRDCICEGKNHAVGLEKAMLNARELFHSGKFPDSFRFAPVVRQESFIFSPFEKFKAPD